MITYLEWLAAIIGTGFITFCVLFFVVSVKQEIRYQEARK